MKTKTQRVKDKMVERKEVTLAEALNPCLNAMVRIERKGGKRYLVRNEFMEINGKNCMNEVTWDIGTNRFMGMRGGKIDKELKPYFSY